jgi:hypothetical protein
MKKLQETYMVILAAKLFEAEYLARAGEGAPCLVGVTHRFLCGPVQLTKTEENAIQDEELLAA